MAGSGAASVPFNRPVTLKLPEYATIDASFQQKEGACDKPQKWCQISDGSWDITREFSFYRVAQAMECRRGRAVSEPELKGIDRDANSNITPYEGWDDIYCSVSNSGASPQFGEYSVGSMSATSLCVRPLTVENRPDSTIEQNSERSLDNDRCKIVLLRRSLSKIQH